MKRRSFRQFGLRTLFVVITMMSIIGAYYAKQFRGDRFKHTTNNTLENVRPEDAARRLRVVVAALPEHSLTDEILFPLERHFNAPAFEEIRKTTITDQFYCRVTLSDGSVSTVGFWVYPGKSAVGVNRTRVTVVILGDESYWDIRSGRSARRELERSQLLRKTYFEVIYEHSSPFAMQ